MRAEVFETLEELKRSTGMDATQLRRTLESALVTAYRRKMGSSDPVRVEIDPATSAPHVWVPKTVVDHVVDPRWEVSVTDARTFRSTAQVGAIIECEVTPKHFDRVVIHTVKHILRERLQTAKRDAIADTSLPRPGDLVTGTVRGIANRMIVFTLGTVEVRMPLREKVPGERLRGGELLKLYVTAVRTTAQGPQILVSRRHPGLVEALLALEVPELADGLITVKGIARDAGLQTKIAVWSPNSAVDALGACIGEDAVRVNAVRNALHGEKIEVIPWDSDDAVLVANALAPSQVTSVTLDPARRVAQVLVPEDQRAFAIGKDGRNARLASRLTGWTVKITTESEQASLVNW